jgi:hypothetical protein
MNEARGAHGKISAAQKKKIQVAQKKINAVVAKALVDYMVNEDDEAETDYIMRETMRKIGKLISDIAE